MPFDEVSGDTDLEINVNFSLTIRVDENGKPVHIDKFGFRDDNFIWVELHDPEEYF